MRHDRYDCNPGCPTEAALEIIGGKWKGGILHHLLTGTKRFNELRRLMPAITQRMLTAQLRSLEASNVVRREVFAEVPPRVQYSLTAFGESLRPALAALRAWGSDYLERQRGHTEPTVAATQAADAELPDGTQAQAH